MERLNSKIIFIKYSSGLISKDDLFQYIWDAYGKKISFYISKIISKNNNNFDDIFQEIMFKIFENIETYNPFYSFNTWAYSIARNHTIDFIKKNSAIEVLNSDNMENYKSSQNIEAEFLRKELGSKISKSMNSFNKKEREIAYLRLYEELTFKKIGEITRINTSTVKVIYRKIEKKLFQDLKDYEKI